MPKDTKSLKITGSYTQFSLKLYKDDRLTWAEKAYYIALIDRANFEGRGWSFQTHEKMEERYGFAARYSKDLSASLHKKGFITKKRSKHGFISYPLELFKDNIDKAEEEKVIYMKVHKS